MRNRSSRSARSKNTIPAVEILEPRLLLSGTPSITLIAEYGGSYDSSLKSLGTLDLSDTINQNPTYWHKVDIRVQDNDFVANEDLAAVSFNILVGSGLTVRGASPWNPVTGSFDADNDGETDESFFAINADSGTANDLQSIFVFISRTAANNRQYGEASRPKSGATDTLGYPTLLGSIFVRWDGSATSIGLEPSPPDGAAWSSWDGNGTDSGTLNAHVGDFTTVNYDFPSSVSNTAPVLDNSEAMTLTDIAEDAAGGTGNTVAEILASVGDPVTDVDLGSQEGIAVTAADISHGTWQYSTDDGSTWTALGTVSASSARLLRDTDRLRFIPQANFNGTSSLSFRAWDVTSGSAGDLANPGSGGGNSAFSTAVGSADLTVTATNDAPSAGNQSLDALPGVSTDITLAGSDIETARGSLAFNITAGPTHGTLTDLGGGIFRYTPTAGFTGADAFSYTVTDSGDPAGSHSNPSDLTSSEGTVSLTVAERLNPTLGVVTYTDQNGVTVRVQLRGPGSFSVLRAQQGLADADEITLSGTSLLSRLTITTIGVGSHTAVGAINLQGNSLGAIVAGSTDLVGEGVVGGSTGLCRDILVRNLSNGADITLPATDALGLILRASQFDSGSDVTLGSPLRSLTISGWTGGELTATRAGNLLIRGDMGANVNLTGQDLRGSSLGLLNVLGKIVGSTIVLEGTGGKIMTSQWDSGSVTADALASLMILGNRLNPAITGNFGANVTLRNGTLGMLHVAGHVTGGAINLGSGLAAKINIGPWDDGSLTAGTAGNIIVRGDLAADITLTGQDLRGSSLGMLHVQGRIIDSTIVLEGSAGKIMTPQWDSGSVTADALANLLILGNRLNPAITGNFGANVTLRNGTLGLFQVAGHITGSAIDLGTGVAGRIIAGGWDDGSLSAGTAGTILIRGDLDADVELTSFDFRGNSLGSLTASGKILADTIEIEGAAGKIVAAQWDGGSLTAGALASLQIVGNRLDAAITGNFGANVTLNGGLAVRTLGGARVVGQVTGGTWSILAGDAGAIAVGSSDTDWQLTVAGGLLGLDAVGTLSGSVQASWAGNVTTRSNMQDFQLTLSQTPTLLRPTLRRLSAAGWMTRVRVQSQGNINEVLAGAMRDSSIFAGVAVTHDNNTDGVLDLLNPGAGDTFSQQAQIGLLRVAGLIGEPVDFINSNIAAWRISTGSTCLAQTSPGGEPFGLAFHEYGRLSHRELSGTQTWPKTGQPPLSGEVTVVENMVYRIV